MRSISIATALVAALASAPSFAFKIDPWSYRPPGISPQRIEAQLETFLRNPRMLLLGPIAFGSRLPAAMGQLKEATHENLTELSIRCALAPLARGQAPSASITSAVSPADAPAPASSGLITRCAGRSGALLIHAPDLSEEQQDLIRAVRFNDAPPVKLASGLMSLIVPSALVCGEVRVPENAGCWALIMGHAAGLAAADPGNTEFGKAGNFLYRTHFGDMQFMHAMAARGETLARTQERILLWMRFTWQVATGEIATDARIDTLAPEFGRDILASFDDRTVAQFFETRSGTPPERIRRLALGALLHTVQDSFADGHAERDAHEPGAEAHFGAIRAFLNYGCQSDVKHGEADRAAHYKWFSDATHEQKSPVTLGAQLIDFALMRKLGWEAPISAGGVSVAQYVSDTMFPIVTANALNLAGAGAPFLRTRTPAGAVPNDSMQAAPPPEIECKS